MSNGKTIPTNIQEPEKTVFDKSSMADKNLHLSIEIRERLIYVCLLDKDANQYVAWASYKRKNEKLSGMTDASIDIKLPIASILKEEIFQLPYSGSSVVFVHNSAMLIPGAYFSPDLVKDYLSQQNLMKPGERPSSDFIKNNDCHSIYAVDLNDYHVLKEKYPHAVIRHHSSVFVEYLLALHKNNSGNEVHVYVFENYMDVAALQAGKLLLYNRYYIQTANDFTYFLLWVYEELKLKPDDSACTLYGEITSNSEMYKLAAVYIKNIRLAERNTQFGFSNKLKDLPSHAYYSLFMQYLCI